MNESRKLAADLMGEAAKIVTTERGNQHGGAEDSFGMIAALWTVYLENTNKMRYANDISLIIKPEDVAEMMSLLKKARKVHGDPTNRDNHVDDLGYTALAGQLSIEARLDKSYNMSDSEMMKALGSVAKEGPAVVRTVPRNTTQTPPANTADY